MRKKKILVIDDDEMNLQIAKMIFEKKLSCEVICTDNGKDGVEILRREQVNLVLLDIMMPEQDGIETLEKIRDDESLKKVSVMMLTAANGIENLKKVYTLGVKDYIKKPFLPADLIRRVEKKLSEVHSEEILLLGDDQTVLQSMKKLIEENFEHEVLIANEIESAEKILNEQKIKLIIVCAEMKFINGFKFLKLLASDDRLEAIPLTITTTEKLLEVIERINCSKIYKYSPIIEKIPAAVVSQSEKKKIVGVVTNLIGYDLDIHI